MGFQTSGGGILDTLQILVGTCVEYLTTITMFYLLSTGMGYPHQLVQAAAVVVDVGYLLVVVKDREQVIKAMLDRGVQVASHYVPLHSSPGGQKYGRSVGDMAVTNDISQRLIGLPLYYGLTPHDQATVVQALEDVLRIQNI